jgi:hypothetical protein
LSSRYQTMRKPKSRRVRSLKVIIHQFASSLDAKVFFTGVLDGSKLIRDAAASRVIDGCKNFTNIKFIWLGLCAGQRQTRPSKNETAVTGDVPLFIDFEAGFYESVVRSAVLCESDSFNGLYVQLPAGTIG